MRRLAICAAVGALLAGAADGAWGQAMTGRRASQFDLGVYAGGSLSSDWFTSRTLTLNGTGTPTENDDEEGYSPGAGGAFGGLATFWLTPSLGVRVHGAYLPLRLPEGDGESGTDGYVMNTYVYDLNLALRPFAARAGAVPWLSSLYLFVGGGGLTVDLAGEDRALCEGTLAAQGACLSFAPEQATVGQGTAGVGFDLLPLGSTFGVFAEAAAHVYDSPVHVDDEWLGPITGRAGNTVRIGDDAVAVTGRLVLGVRAGFGNLIPAPPVVIPPSPPPPPAVIPPPPPAMQVTPVREIRVCVVENGMLREMTASYNVQTGDTTVNGQPFSRMPTAGYAAGAAWFIDNEAITVMDRRYVRYGLPRVLGVNEVSRTAEYQGVPVFAEAGAAGTPEVLYVPVRPGCEFQPYQLEVKAGGVRGE
jgi:hypothetical protein